MNNINRTIIDNIQKENNILGHCEELDPVGTFRFCEKKYKNPIEIEIYKLGNTFLHIAYSFQDNGKIFMKRWVFLTVNVDFIIEDIFKNSKSGHSLPEK